MDENPYRSPASTHEGTRCAASVPWTAARVFSLLLFCLAAAIETYSLAVYSLCFGEPPPLTGSDPLVAGTIGFIGTLLAVILVAIGTVIRFASRGKTQFHNH